MPIGYGSNFPLSKLSTIEVGVTLNTVEKSIIPFLRILTTVVEVIFSEVPGVPEGAATAFALASANINTALDVSETGSVNLVNALINYGAAAVPGISSGMKYTRETGIANALRGGSKAGEGTGGSFINQLRKDYKDVSSGLKNRLERSIMKEKYGVNDSLTKYGKNIFNSPSKTSDSFFMSRNLRKPFSDENIEGFLSDKIAKRLETVKGIQSKIEKFSNAKKVSPQELRSFLKTVGKEGYGGSAARAARRFGGGRIAQETALGGSYIIGDPGNRSVLNEIQDATGLFKNEVNALLGLIKGGLITDIKKFKAIIEKAFKRSGNEFLAAFLVGTKQSKFMKLLLRTETTAEKASRISSKTFAWGTKVGGYITSPSSLAADAISKTVAKVTSGLEKYGEKFAEKFAKYFKKGTVGLHKLETEFERTGGELIKSSWIMGYKLLQNEDMFLTILIQFKVNHPNVIVRLNSSTLKAWLESNSKGRFYIDNFARSRGGRKVTEIGITGKLSNVLGFLPISKINEVIGFAGFSKGFIQSIKSNQGALIWHTGQYMEGFKSGIIQGLISEGVKGAVGFGTRNQYAKQVFEGGINSMIGGQSFGASFSNSFNTAATSLRDTTFEDKTTSGGLIKQIKPIQAGGTSLKGLFGG